MSQEEETMEPPLKKRKLTKQEMTTKPELLIGLKVEVDWGNDGKFVGQVAEFNPEKKTRKWNIKYEDGDDEWGTFANDFATLKVHKGERPLRWIGIQPVFQKGRASRGTAAAGTKSTSSSPSHNFVRNVGPVAPFPSSGQGEGPCNAAGEDSQHVNAVRGGLSQQGLVAAAGSVRVKSEVNVDDPAAIAEVKLQPAQDAKDKQQDPLRKVQSLKRDGSGGAQIETKDPQRRVKQKLKQEIKQEVRTERQPVAESNALQLAGVSSPGSLSKPLNKATSHKLNDGISKAQHANQPVSSPSKTQQVYPASIPKLKSPEQDLKSKPEPSDMVTPNGAASLQKPHADGPSPALKLTSKAEHISQVDMAKPPAAFKSTGLHAGAVFRTKFDSRSSINVKTPAAAVLEDPETERAAVTCVGATSASTPAAAASNGLQSDKVLPMVTGINGSAVKVVPAVGTASQFKQAAQGAPASLDPTAAKPAGRTTAAAGQTAAANPVVPSSKVAYTPISLAGKDTSTVVVRPAGTVSKPDTATAPAGKAAPSQSATADPLRHLLDAAKLAAKQMAASISSGTARPDSTAPGTAPGAKPHSSPDDILRQIMANAAIAQANVQANKPSAIFAAGMAAAPNATTSVTTIGAASTRITVRSRSVSAQVEKTKEEQDLEALVDNISGSDKVIKSAAMKAIEVGKKSGPKKVIRMILEKLKSHTDSAKRVHLLFLVDSIVQKSMGLKDDTDNPAPTFPSCVAAALSDLVRHSAKDEISLVKVEKVVNVWQKKAIFAQCGAGRELERVMEELEDLKQQILPPEMLSDTVDASGNRTRLHKVCIPTKSFGPEIITAYLANPYGSLGKGEPAAPACAQLVFPAADLEVKEADWGMDFFPPNGKFITWAHVMENPALQPGRLALAAPSSPTIIPCLSPSARTLEPAESGPTQMAPNLELGPSQALDPNWEGAKAAAARPMPARPGLPPGLQPDVDLAAVPGGPGSAIAVGVGGAVGQDAGCVEPVPPAVDLEDTWSYSPQSPAVFNMPRAPSHGPPTTGRASSGAGSDVDYDDDDFSFVQHGSARAPPTSPGPILVSVPYLAVSIPGVGAVQDSNPNRPGSAPVNLLRPLASAEKPSNQSGSQLGAQLGSQLGSSQLAGTQFGGSQLGDAAAPIQSWVATQEPSSVEAAAGSHPYGTQPGTAAIYQGISAAPLEHATTSWGGWTSRSDTTQQPLLQQQHGKMYGTAATTASLLQAQYSVPQAAVASQPRPASPSQWGMEDVPATTESFPDASQYSATTTLPSFTESRSPARDNTSWHTSQQWAAQAQLWDPAAQDPTTIDTWDPHNAPSARDTTTNTSSRAHPVPAAGSPPGHFQQAPRWSTTTAHSSHLPPGFGVSSSAPQKSLAGVLPPHLAGSGTVVTDSGLDDMVTDSDSYRQPVAVTTRTDSMRPPLPEQPPPMPDDEDMPPLPSEPPPPLEEVPPPPLPDYDPDFDPPPPPPDLPPLPPSDGTQPAGPGPYLSHPALAGLPHSVHSSQSHPAAAWPPNNPAPPQATYTSHTYPDSTPAPTPDIPPGFSTYSTYHRGAYPHSHSDVPSQYAPPPGPPTGGAYPNGSSYPAPAMHYQDGTTQPFAPEQHCQPYQDASPFPGAPPSAGKYRGGQSGSVDGRGRGPGRPWQAEASQRWG